MTIRPEQWREGLLVRSPNWLGDLVMTFPALMLLKRLLPEFCSLSVICPAGLAPVHLHARDLACAAERQPRDFAGGRFRRRERGPVHHLPRILPDRRIRAFREVGKRIAANLPGGAAVERIALELQLPCARELPRRPLDRRMAFRASPVWARENHEHAFHRLKLHANLGSAVSSGAPFGRLAHFARHGTPQFGNAPGGAEHETVCGLAVHAVGKEVYFRVRQGAVGEID